MLTPSTRSWLTEVFMVCVAFAAVVFAGLVLSGIVGCEPPPMATTPEAQAKSYGVRKLFTYDGCTVYAFGAFHAPGYFANCPHGSVAGALDGPETPTAYDVPRGTSVP